MYKRAYTIGFIWLLFIIPMFFMKSLGSWMTEYIFTIQILSALFTVYFCFSTNSILDKDDPNKKIWSYLSIATLMWAIGLAAYAIFDTIMGSVPFPWFTDVFYISFTLLVLTGLFLFWKTMKLKFPKWGWIVGSLVFVGVLVWSVIVAQKGIAADTNILKVVATYFYLIGDSLLVFFSILLASALIGGMLGNQLWILILGFFVYFIGEQLFISTNNLGTYQKLGYIEIFWPIAFGLISVAAIATKSILQKKLEL